MSFIICGNCKFKKENCLDCYYPKLEKFYPDREDFFIFYGKYPEDVKDSDNISPKVKEMIIKLGLNNTISLSNTDKMVVHLEDNVNKEFIKLMKKTYKKEEMDKKKKAREELDKIMGI